MCLAVKKISFLFMIYKQGDEGDEESLLTSRRKLLKLAGFGAAHSWDCPISPGQEPPASTP